MGGLFPIEIIAEPIEEQIEVGLMCYKCRAYIRRPKTGKPRLCTDCKDLGEN